MRSTRLVLRGARVLCITASQPGAQQRCFSSIGGPSAASNAHSGKDSSSTSSSTSQAARVGVAGAIASGICLAWFSGVGRENEDQDRDHLPGLLPQLRAADSENREAKVSIRERRYKDFSSISYKGEPYMTPRDFLESVTSDEPRQHEPQFLNDRDVQKLLKSTIPRTKGTIHTFRDMWNEGILTYADYLFLLTALVKTTRQFEIAFRMIDADGNDYLDLKEFSKVQEAVTKQRDNALIQQSLEASSLTIHLFGNRGNQRLYSKDFYKFIQDLQTEVLEIEFNKFAGGAPTISEEDFARVLLRHTSWDLDPVFERLKRKSKPETGIYFKQFCDFCLLLNLLDDFEVAMTMFTIAGACVTEEEFGRAAKICLGRPLDKFIVSTVFNIFDVDGDGKLSYREFLSVMKSWKLRGFKMREHKHIGGWSEFKTCVKMEMNNR